jgi:hypothetical protein
VKIYRCDNCGLTVEHATGIVGNEFDYSRKFETLAPAYRANGVVDLCSPCYQVAQSALFDSRKDAQEKTRAGFIARFFGAQP